MVSNKNFEREKEKFYEQHIELASIVLLKKKVIDNLDEETNCSQHITITISFCFYILLYPFLWNILVTVWFINILEKQMLSAYI